MKAVMDEVVMEAVMEADPGKSGRESGMRKPGREPSMGEMHLSAHAAEVHATAVPAAATAMHTTTAAAAMAAAAAPRERGWRHGKRRDKRTRDEAIKELVVHPNSSVVELLRRIASLEEDSQQIQMIQRFQMTNATVSDREVSFSVRGKPSRTGAGGVSAAWAAPALARERK
jgi:hypothetical protein